jgi:hypothetical protein
MIRSRTSVGAGLVLCGALASAVVASCSTSGQAEGGASSGASNGGPGTCTPSDGDGGASDANVTALSLPQLSPTRLLRRASMALRLAPPTLGEYEKVEKAGVLAAQYAAVDAFINATMTDPVFYETMFQNAFEWFAIPPIPNDADEPEYGIRQQHNLLPCPAGTLYAGAWTYGSHDILDTGGDGTVATVKTANLCNGLMRDGSTPAGGVRKAESRVAWWSGKAERFVGDTVSSAKVGRTPRAGGGTYDCDTEVASTVETTDSCGCGPHAERCHPEGVLTDNPDGTQSFLARGVGGGDFNPQQARGQRRLAMEEPARLFAHLAWHDRPLSDLMLGDYSVAPTDLQSAYVRMGAYGGRTEAQFGTQWWTPSGAEPANPGTKAGDRWAWREYKPEALTPFLLSDRNYKFDPAASRELIKGIPSAGILTTYGFNGAYKRERVRAARALELLACEAFIPPSADVKFSQFKSDPSKEGTCQHCHNNRIDPAAVHFKRFTKLDLAYGHPSRFGILGATEWWRAAPLATWGARDGYQDHVVQWQKWWVPERGLLPGVSAQTVAAKPEVIFKDSLPPSETLLGQTSDGTVGPLGFAKMVDKSGAFDRCMVRRLHQQVVGRDISTGEEAGYLDALVQKFRASGRKVRPFVKELTSGPLFRGGR